MVWELLVGPFQLSIFSGSVIDRRAEVLQQSCTACCLENSCSNSDREPFFWEQVFFWKEIW